MAISLRNLSPKQQDFVFNSTARMNIAEGSVSSGKTYSSLIAWIKFVETEAQGDVIVAGKTNGTLERNIVDPLYGLLGGDMSYSRTTTRAKIYGKTWHFLGLNNLQAEHKLRGMTAAGAYIDELTLIPQPCFEMLKSRCRIPGSKIFATTNPDSPFHWVKTDYLDREHEIDLKRFSFRIEDNPYLDESYVNDLKTSYTGLFFRRYINGEWCMAEGTIYSQFNEEIHTIVTPPALVNDYYVGVDYGMVNPTAFTLIAYNKNGYPRYWVEREYYFDSRKQNYQKSDTELADDLQAFIKDLPVRGIYVDPSAQSFIVELNRRGIRHVEEADNEVLKGISFVSQLLSDGSLKISKNCNYTIQEFSSYSWDENSQKLGVDKPKKQHDHCFSGETLINTDLGKLPIKQITKGMNIMTLTGFRKVKHIFKRLSKTKEFYINCSLGMSFYFKCTKSHKFYTGDHRWVEIHKLRPGDDILVCRNVVTNGFYKQSGLVMDGTFDVPVLKIKDQAKADNFKWYQITEVLESDQEKEEWVYNLHVEKEHLYFANDVLVKNCFEAGTVVATEDGDKFIEDIKVGDKVLTPVGFFPVLRTFKQEALSGTYDILGQKIRCTPDHEFYTANRGWIKAQDLIHSDMFLISIEEKKCLDQNLSFFKKGSIEGNHRLNINPIETILNTMKRDQKNIDFSIEISTNPILEKYPKDTIFITSTTIPSTMTLATLSVYQYLNTPSLISKIFQKIKKEGLEIIVTKSARLQKNGIEAMPGENGIETMPTTACLDYGVLDTSTNASSVEKSSIRGKRDQDFVTIIANLCGEEPVKLTMRAETVQYVLKNLELTNIPSQNVALEPVESYLRQTPVYNLHVDAFHNYFVHNILTLNCLDSLRYAMVSAFYEDYGDNNDRLTKTDWNKLYHKHSGYKPNNTDSFWEV